MFTEILITRTDGKQTCMDVSPALLDLLISAIDVGADGFGQGYNEEATEEEAWTFINQLKEFRDEPEWDAPSKENYAQAKIENAKTLLKSAGFVVTKDPALVDYTRESLAHAGM